MDSLGIRVNMTLTGKTTTQLAKQAGVSRFQAWRWQRGRPGVAPETAARLERALFSGNGTGTDAREKISAA